MMRMFGVELVYNHADYRLMSRRAIGELENLKRSISSCAASSP